MVGTLVVLPVVCAAVVDPSAHASMSNGSAVVACADARPFRALPTGGVQHPSPAQIAQMAAVKAAARHTDPSTMVPLSTTQQADLAAGVARKRADARAMAAASARTSDFASPALMTAACGGPARLSAEADAGIGGAPYGLAGALAQASSGNPAYAWINSLDQQTQQRWSWCGPTTISEISVTYPPAAYVSQSTAAIYTGQYYPINGQTNYLGTDPWTLTSVLNTHVANLNQANYAWVYWPNNPTWSQYQQFIADVQTDVAEGWPLVGGVQEVYNGPHLAGHPNLTSVIDHFIEIGGWSYDGNGNYAVYYADSAQNPFGTYRYVNGQWVGVPQFSWIDGWTLAIILGGYGYGW
jgi:hypothetical protein